MSFLCLSLSKTLARERHKTNMIGYTLVSNTMLRSIQILIALVLCTSVSIGLILTPDDQLVVKRKRAIHRDESMRASMRPVAKAE